MIRFGPSSVPLGLYWLVSLIKGPSLLVVIKPANDKSRTTEPFTKGDDSSFLHLVGSEKVKAGKRFLSPTHGKRCRCSKHIKSYPSADSLVAGLPKKDINEIHDSFTVNLVLYWWRCKNPERFLKGTKWNVQQALGSKVPNSILNFMFKLRFRRLTSADLI
ncbi:unnamed protein product [Notodromas monacha]|uniref:Uncharacterized protein n=1 Tax=Notodromas monacha TaxID=399045 RepID=A0A7R9BJT2_9CRUS|nr:unnamed protein product [Notodromas monacha]CAG0915679.1 unnamed protein product [Notodromas monacha]